MQKNEDILEDAYVALNDLLKPYRREYKLREKNINFINQCMRAVDRDNFFSLSEQMETKQAKDIVVTEGLQDFAPIFKQLKEYSNNKVDLYRVEFVDALQALADEKKLPLSIDFPRFSVLKGIDGEINFAQRTTRINKKVLKSIDPKRIISELQKAKHQYYERKFDPQLFIDNFYTTYLKLLKDLDMREGEAVPIQQFYLQYVLSMQSKTFFQSFEKGRFKEYSVEQLSIDLWCYFDSDIKGTSVNANELTLRPGRNFSLWLIDRDGEKRQISGIAFQ